MRTDELLVFLRKLDQRLEEPASVTVIGGAAAVLAYGAKRPTGDIDTWGSVPGSVEKAAREILEQGDGFVPIGSAGVADLPYEAEDRFRHELLTCGYPLLVRTHRFGIHNAWL